MVVEYKIQLRIQKFMWYDEKSGTKYIVIICIIYGSVATSDHEIVD